MASVLDAVHSEGKGKSKGEDKHITQHSSNTKSLVHRAQDVSFTADSMSLNTHVTLKFK